MKLLKHRLFSLALGLLFVGVFSGDAVAQIKVTMNKAHLLRLDRDASIVMLADPGIADVVLESRRLIFILGRTPGETNLYILDRRGNRILIDAIVVIPNNDRQVTMHRNTEESTLSCAPRCALVPTPGSEAVATAAPPPVALEAAGSTPAATAEAGG